MTQTVPDISILMPMHQDPLLVVLKKSSSTEYVLNEHEALCHYGPYAAPPKMMLIGVYPASTAILFDKLVDLLCQCAQLALTMRLMGIWP